MALGGGAELLAGKPEAVGDRVRMLEQDRALGGEPEPTGLALEQPDADLALERCDLCGDRRLGEGELARRGGERALVRDGAEREHAARIHRERLSDHENHDLKLWAFG